MVGSVVLVRDNLAGVHVGELAEWDPVAKIATLTDARKVWRWFGALSVHDIAVTGIDQRQSKVSVAVSRVILCNVVEVVATSEAGAVSVRNAPVFKP